MTQVWVAVSHETPRASIARLDGLIRKQVVADRTATKTLDTLLDIRLHLMGKRDAQAG